MRTGPGVAFFGGPQGVVDPSWAATRFLAPLNSTHGTAEKRLSLSVAASGSAAVTGAQGPFSNGSAVFAGGSDRLAYALGSLPAALDMSTLDFTVECWIRPTALSGFQEVLCTNDAAGTHQGFFLLTNGTELRFNFTSDGVNFGSNALNTASAGLANNVWSHLAASRISGVLTIYVGGVSKVSASRAAAIHYSSTQGVCIGQSPSGPSPFSGYVGDVRIKIGVGLYTANFTPPAAPVPIQ